MILKWKKYCQYIIKAVQRDIRHVSFKKRENVIKNQFVIKKVQFRNEQNKKNKKKLNSIQHKLHLNSEQS